MNRLRKARVTTSLQWATSEHKRNSCQVLKKLKPWAPPPYVVWQMTSKTFANMYKKMSKGRVAVGWPLSVDLRWNAFQETATQRQKHHAPSLCCCFLLKLQINKVWSKILLWVQEWHSEYNGNSRQLQICAAMPEERLHKGFLYPVHLRDTTVLLCMTWKAQWHCQMSKSAVAREKIITVSVY